MMQKLYHIHLCDDEAGEVEGMFDETGKMLGTWCNNDATWRNEYFDGFMSELGFEITDPPKKLRTKLEKALRETWTQ